MVTLGDVISTDFLLLHGDWPMQKVRDLLGRVGPVYAVIRIDEGWGYLFDVTELMVAFQRISPDTLMRDALAPFASHLVPVVDALSNADDVPDTCLAAECGVIVGVFDLNGAGGSPALEAVRGRGHALSADAAAPGAHLSRWLHAELPDRVLLNDLNSLLIYLSAETQRDQNQHDQTVPITLPRGSAIDIVIQARRGFRIEGRSEAQWVLSDEGETPPIQVKLRATELGIGRIRIYAYFAGNALGFLEIAAVVEAAETTPAHDAPRGHQSALVRPVAHHPDLMLLILEQFEGGERTITMRLSARDPQLGLNFKPFAPVRLRSNPLTFFSEFFRDIENLRGDSAHTRAARAQQLAAKGSWLFESLFPETLRSLVWELRDRISSVQIQSDEPWIPWEICKLQGRRDDGWVDEGLFLCEAFDIARWIPGVPLVPNLRLDNLAVVVPGGSRLPFAPSERQYLLSLAAGRRQVTPIPANFLAVIEGLACGAYDGWHFTGHGLFRDTDPNRSAILLENQEELRPADLSGRVRNLGRSHPLVFLNACQVARAALSLTDVGGWASQCLNAGAGAFVGTYWSIADRAAFEFARTFYDRLLAGVSLGRATREARLQIKGAADPTYLAYAVYGDPNACLSAE